MCVAASATAKAHVLNEVERRAVGPVEVLEDQHCRTALRECQTSPGDRAEQAELLGDRRGSSVPIGRLGDPAALEELR